MSSGLPYLRVAAERVSTFRFVVLGHPPGAVEDLSEGCIANGDAPLYLSERT